MGRSAGLDRGCVPLSPSAATFPNRRSHLIYLPEVAFLGGEVFGRQSSASSKGEVPSRRGGWAKGLVDSEWITYRLGTDSGRPAGRPFRALPARWRRRSTSAVWRGEPPGQGPLGPNWAGPARRRPIWDSQTDRRRGFSWPDRTAVQVAGRRARPTRMNKSASAATGKPTAANRPWATLNRQRREKICPPTGSTKRRQMNYNFYKSTPFR